jgi:hypothetical protein
MNSKFTLALIALVGIGVFALPSTMALFAGQHSFYNIDATGNQVPCTKCHGDVKAELTSGGSTVTGTKGPHAEFKCEYCHRAEVGFSSGDDAIASIRYSGTDGTRLTLVTTIANVERGNFPKSIVYASGMTVDNWAAGVFNLDGTPFVNQSDYDNEYHLYSGNLSTSGTVGITYTVGPFSEVGTYNATLGAPKDTNTATQKQAVDVRKVQANIASTDAAFYGAGSREVMPGTRYHAASLVSCMECHGGEQTKGVAGYEIETAEPYNHAGWLTDASDPNSKCSNCHYGMSTHTPSFEAALAAGGFGLTGAANDTGDVEAHKDFVTASGGVLRNDYGAANDACVGCHTHVAVDINFQKKYKLKFDANAFTGGLNGSHGTWGVGGFGAEGTVDISVYGNGSGETFATSDKTYNWNTTETLYIIEANGSRGSQVQGLTNDASDNRTALTT